MDKAILSISADLTKKLVRDDTIMERALGSDSYRLYQYLDWTARMNNLAQTVSIVVDGNGQEWLVIDVELHGRRGEKLYALCSPRDTAKAAGWTMVSLLTLSELRSAINIENEDVPRGVREVWSQFEHHRTNKDTLRGLKEQYRVNGNRRLKFIRNSRKKFGGKRRRRRRPKAATFKRSLFTESVSKSLNCPDVPLVPITTRSDKTYRVDYLLPVQLGSEWVGVVFRDGQSVMMLLDSYDIVNKAILCDPSFDAAGFQWFSNSVDKVVIVPDDEETGPQTITKSPTPAPVLTPSAGLDGHHVAHSPPQSVYGYLVPVELVPNPTTQQMIEIADRLRVRGMFNALYFQNFRNVTYNRGHNTVKYAQVVASDYPPAEPVQEPLGLIEELRLNPTVY